MKAALQGCFVFCLTILVGFAQTPSASVVGHITDPTGAVIPGIAIKVTNTATNQTTKGSSNESGDFTVPYLTPGAYTLEAESQGFRTFRYPDFTIEADQSLRVDIRMEVGSTTETITVTDRAPALNTESGTRGDVTTNQEITEMPLAGRNFSDLAYLTGGVIPKGEDGDGAFAINGARADNVGFSIDGMNNTQRRNTGAMVSPPLEGVQEFKLMTSGFSAEYGRYAGGILSVVMKSGGNKLRGSLYEFIRNDLIDSRNFFDIQKGRLRRNQYGATLSGPVRIPKLYNGRDKTFFLFTWESIRQVSGATQRGITPSADFLRGDFSRAVNASGKPLTLTDPIAKAPFPNNQIPASRFDPMSVKLAAFYPAPNLPTGANNYIAQGNPTSEVNNYGGKVDHAIGANDRLTFSGYYRPNKSFNPFSRSPISAFGPTSNSPGTLIGVRWLKTMGPSLFNETNTSFSRLTLYQGWPDNTRDWSGEIGFVGGSKSQPSLGLPQIDVSGYISLGHAYDLPKIWAYNNYQISDSMTWIRGKHNFKFGGDALHYQYYTKSYGDIRGRLAYLGRFTGEPVADFMLGYVQTSRRQTDVAREYMQVYNYSAFLQDDYRVRRNLTLNLGLRYELMMQPTEKYGARSMFIPSLGKVVLAGDGGVSNVNELIASTGLQQYVAFARDLGLSSAIVNTRKNNFAPRFGFAWRPFNNNKSVIRGGYGIFFGQSSLYRYDDLTNIFPFSINESYSATTSNPLLLTTSSPYPVSRRNVAGITTASGQNLDDKDQYLQSWSMTLEREFWGGTVVEVAYSGSKGSHLPRRYDVNQPFRDPAFRPTGTGAFPRPFPAFGTVNIFANVSNSIYNSGSTTLRRRVNRDMFFRASYVYSKSIDESSNLGGTISAGFPTAQDSRNLHAERGRSDFDIGHAVSASFIWTPKFTRQLFIRNWQLAGTSRAYTGPPFTLKLANYSLDSGEAIRPDRIANGALENPTPDAWYDRSAFVAVPPGSYRFGSSGRNVLDGPGFFTFDSSLSRRFRTTETTAVQLRAEVFNLSNRANFSLPQTQVDVLNSAVISQAKAPRIYQLGLRLEF